MRLTGIPRASNAPRMARVKQQFSGPMLQDIHAAVRQTLGSLPLPIKPGQTVALAVGSRGIVNIDVVAKAAVDHVKALGAKPFIFPAMGSHGGGTAEGQRSVLEHYGVTEATWREAVVGSPHFVAISESPRFVGRAVAALAADPQLQRRSGGSFSSGGLAREYGFTDVDGSRPDCWRYLVEVQEAGRPADATGYR